MYAVKGGTLVEKYSSVAKGDFIRYNLDKEEVMDIISEGVDEYVCGYCVATMRSSIVELKDILSVTPSKDCPNILLVRDFVTEKCTVLFAYTGKYTVGQCLRYAGLVPRYLEVVEVLNYKSVVSLSYDVWYLSIELEVVAVFHNAELSRRLVLLEAALKNVTSELQKAEDKNTAVDKAIIGLRHSAEVAEIRDSYIHTHDRHGNLLSATMANPCTESFGDYYRQATAKR